MRKLELAAAVLVLATLVGLPAGVFGYESLRHRTYDGEVITLAGADGVWNQETLRVKQGDKVRLRLTSDDVVHGFMLKGYDIEVREVYPGRVEVVEFVAGEAGTFVFTCTVLCSSHHRDMKGSLVVDVAEASPVNAISG